MQFRNALLRLSAALVLLTGVSSAAMASSHSEAPGTAIDRIADDTDLYAWVAPDAPNAVTIVGNWIPLLEPNSGPNFASFGENLSYYINIDNVGDAKKHIRYEFKFTNTRQNPNTFLYNTGVVNTLTDPNLNVRQTYTVTRIVNGAETTYGPFPSAPWFVGPRSMPNYKALAQAAIQTLPDGTRLFVGPRDDPFFVDLAAIFDLLTIRRVPGNRGGGVDGVSGYNVMSIVLQIPKASLTKDGVAPSADLHNEIIGIWDTAERPQTRVINGDGTISYSGPEIQVSRLGMPLVNEVVIPLKDKDKFNASEPENDVANFAGYVVNPELAGLLQALYGLTVPPTPRNDLVTVFATGIPGVNQPQGVVASEMLRLNMTIPPAQKPNRFGVIAGDAAGFPNGRRLADDVVDIAERVVAGGYVLTPQTNVAPNNQLGDGVDANDVPYLPYFPYVAPPHNPFVNDLHDADIRHFGHGRGGDPGDDDGDRWNRDVTTPISEEFSLTGGSTGSRALLHYTLPANGRVSLKIFDLQGRSVRTLVDQDAAAGSFRAVWDGRTQSGATAERGVYFARLVVDGRATEGKKIVIR
jgi:hypothetical protein